MKVLAVRNDRFGEFLLNIPAFRALKQSFNNSYLVLIVDSYVSELAECIDFVDEVMVWENKKHKFSELLKFSAELKNKRFDLCVIFNPSKEFNIISFLAGIPLRAGYKRKWGFLLTHKMKDEKYLGKRHEIEYNLELAKLVGASTQDKSLSLDIDGNTVKDLFKEHDIEEIDRPIAIHPWTSDPIKQWPLTNFKKLAEKLVKELKLKVIIVGAESELNKSREIFYNQGALINMTGKTTLKQLAALLKKCKLLVSGDSGPVHLASCMGIPVVAIFRNDLAEKGPLRWGPVGGESAVVEKSSLSDITVDEVLSEIKRRLGI